MVTALSQWIQLDGKILVFLVIFRLVISLQQGFLKCERITELYPLERCHGEVKIGCVVFLAIINKPVSPVVVRREMLIHEIAADACCSLLIHFGRRCINQSGQTGI